MDAEGAATLAATLKNDSRKYPDRGDPRFIPGGLIFPDLRPGFAIPRGSTVFTIGSCFARNVEEALIAAGMDVPTARFRAPPEEAPGRPNRILNQYNPGTMLACVSGGVEGRRGLYPAPGGKVVDALLATGSRAVTEERALARRAEIAALYQAGLARAGTAIVTLGLIECWYDLEDAIWLNEAPPARFLRAHPGRFAFRRLGHAACQSLVFDLVGRLRSGGARNVVLTVSPVPLQLTFTGGDAVTANAYSKALLRVVAEEVAGAFPGVDYFPSYETVTTAGLSAFGEDNVHVRPKVVETVVARMLTAYAAAPAEAPLMAEA
ncbi:GSCFA domain-containing protein [Ovoidimarina sediminis]|uniref:GSCFA domain-containing protein n=1 Tax=Ovoidimarina sediminis TaxID=3079856 RepID=UPI00290ABC38|nr:GSCFA domain-containing protein [Rhodophyticola sp. MJ-SS7]MDU8942836.1 GSCFA domain-containing protein [Rhodophyticola sp. MJ-SS7]